MSVPPSINATEIGEAPPKRIVRTSNRPMRDLDNSGQVFVLATEIADDERKSARIITGLSVDEIRAIAQFAASAGVVLHCALTLLEASDSGDETETRARLTTLCNVTRALITLKETKQ